MMEPSFVEASRHVPRILRRQLMCNLTNQYFNADAQDNKVDPRLSRPSIERFYGALLFVDISGFTALSLKLDIEALRRHINEYFTKMLSIVEKWDGDVIKFAGDALYIAWPVNSEFEADPYGKVEFREDRDKVARELIKEPKFLTSSKATIERAVACALEINAACCNHKIIIEEPLNSRGSLGKFSQMLNSLPVIFNSGKPGSASFLNQKELSAISSDSTCSSNAVYLNVHSGIGFGLLAGVDVGSKDRWEYFLLGEPLSQVAIAESLADTGDVVISGIAHAIIHKVDLSESYTVDNSSHLYSCGCFKLALDFCRISKVVVVPKRRIETFSRRQSRNRLKYGEKVSLNDEKISVSYSDDFDKLVSLKNPTIKSKINAFLEMHNIDLNPSVVSHTREPSVGVDNSNYECLNKKVTEDFVDYICYRVYSGWIQNCLVDDLVRHTHEAARSQGDFFSLERTDGFGQFLGKLFLNEEGYVKDIIDVKKQLLYFRESTSSYEEIYKVVEVNEDELGDELSIKVNQEISNGLGNINEEKPTVLSNKKALLSKKSSSNMMQDRSLSAELRTVTVMFIKIDGLQSDIEIDTTDSESEINRDENINPFGFLQRTKSEKLADETLLLRFQDCIDVLCDVFNNHGGQMRQFIIDDKGTVCIATFGLRGSLTIDNAASALEASKNLIIRLQKLGLVASIGTTSGKAYCGLVGSHARHEYAVMGPSTNLSARLMCKASPLTMICDIETKGRDRTHLFESLQEIIAKGYSNPVKTFKPLFEDLWAGSSADTKSKDNVALHALSSGGKFSPGMWRAPSQAFKRGSLEGDQLESMVHTAARGRRFSISENGGKVIESSPANLLCRRLLESDFYLPQRRGSQIGTSYSSPPTFKLYGREKELQEILEFYFASLIESSSSLLQAYHHFSGEEINIKRAFDTSIDCKMIAVCGKVGTGKSALVNSIARKLTLASRKSIQFNYFIFKNRTSSLHASIPFYPWRFIIQDMLVKVFRHKLAEQGDSGTIRQIDEEILGGLEIVMCSLSRELQLLRPLLSFISVIPIEDDNLLTGKVSKRRKYHSLLRLLVTVIQSYVTITGNIAFIILEKLQLFDTWSLTLLHSLWSTGKGIALLTTYCPDQVQDVFGTENSLTYPSTSSSSSIYHIKKGISSKASSIGEIESRSAQSKTSQFFYRWLSSSNKTSFLQVTLSSLDRESVNSLASDVFRTSSHFSKPLLDKIFELSGGNPLYAFELANSANLNICNSSDSSEIFEKVIGMASNRIDEVICYRFDQLDNISQLLLKCAAVISSNGLPFSTEQVLFVLAACQRESFHTSEILASLTKLLEREEFIKLADSIPRENSNDSVEVYCGGLETASFNFRVSLEQLIIYNLLVTEQKETFHDSVGSYYLKLSSKRELSVEEHLEEAFHWQKALVWGHAISCYLKAATKLQEMGDAEGFKNKLQLAFRVYKLMRFDVNLLPPQEMSKERFLCLIGPINATQDESQIPSPRSFKEQQLSYELIHEMCFGDSDTFESIIQLHHLLAQYNSLMMEAPMNTSLAAEECLQLLLLSDSTNQPVKPAIFSSQASDSAVRVSRFVPRTSSEVALSQVSQNSQRSLMRSSSKSHQLSKQASLHRAISIATSPFVIKNHLLMTMNSLSSYIWIQTWAPNSDADRLLKAKHASDKYLIMSRHSSSPHEHLLHSLSLSIGLLVRLRKILDALDSCITLQNIYLQPNSLDGRDSTKLVASFGVDIVPFTFAMVAQQLLVSANMSDSLRLLEISLSLMTEIKHIYSLELAFVAICPNLMLLRRHEDALLLLDTLQDVESTHYGTSILPSSFKDDLQIMFKMRIKLQGSKYGYISENVDISSSFGTLPFALESKEDYVDSSRSYLGHFLAVLGMGTESLKMEIRFLTNLRNSVDDYENTLKLFVEEYSIFRKTHSPNFETFILSDLCPIATVIFVFHGHMDYLRDSSLSSDCIECEILDLVNRCLQNNYHFASSILSEFLCTMPFSQSTRHQGEELRREINKWTSETDVKSFFN